MQRHAAARSEAAECRELQQLRSVYFLWPSVFRIHSSQPELLLGQSGRDLSIRPPVSPSSSVYLSFLPAVRPHLRLGRSDTSFLISGPDNFFLKFLSPDQRCTTGRLLHSVVAGESRSRCFHVRCVPSGDSTATLRCGNTRSNLSSGRGFNISLIEKKTLKEGHVHTVCFPWDGALW